MEVNIYVYKTMKTMLDFIGIEPYDHKYIKAIQSKHIVLFENDKSDGPIIRISAFSQCNQLELIMAINDCYPIYDNMKYEDIQIVEALMANPYEILKAISMDIDHTYESDNGTRFNIEWII